MSIKKVLFFIVLILSSLSLKAQLPEPTSISLGGAGVTYTDGINALWINPANLFFERSGEKFTVQAPRFSAILMNPNLFTSADSRRQNLTQTQSFYSPGSGIDIVQLPAYERFLFRNSRQLYAHYTNTSDISWGKISAKFGNKVLAVGVRSRYETNAIAARSWFEGLPTMLADSSRHNRSMEYLFQVRHEISLGFASTFQYFSSQFSDLRNLTFGFSPKIILPGTFIRRLHSSTVFKPDNGGLPYQQIEALNFSIGTELPPSDYSNTYSPPDNTSMLGNIQGLGVGLDVGLSYVYPIGDDFSILNFRASDAYVKGIRLSIAVLDLGVIKYDNNIQISSGSIDSVAFDNSVNSHLPYIFQGNIGSVDAAVRGNSNEQRITDSLQTSNPKSSWYRTPPTIQGGISIQFGRVQFLSELSYRANDLRGLPESISGHFGLELRPLLWLPLRLGYQVHQTLPPMTTLGAGIDTRFVFANFGIMSYALPRQLSGADRIVAASASLTVGF